MISRYNLLHYGSTEKRPKMTIPPHRPNLFCSHRFYKLLKRAVFVFLTFIHLKNSLWTAAYKAHSVINFNRMASSVLANYSYGEHILHKFLHVLTPTNTCNVTAPTPNFTVCSKQHFYLAVCFHAFILWSAIHLMFCMNNNNKKSFK